MSFRVRVLLLVVLVALTASGAAAWLTVQQASQQLAESQTVDRAQVELITSQLRDYGERHGTWEGVVELVRDLHAQTGQRIHLATESGDVLVDTDTVQGRTARPLGDGNYVVDPRPRLALSGPAAVGAVSDSLDAAKKSVATAIVEYRSGVRFAACLTRNRIDVVTRPGTLGVPRFSAGGSRNPDANEITVQCGAMSQQEGTALAGALLDVSTCDVNQAPSTRPGSQSEVTGSVPATPVPTQTAENETLICLARVFTQQITDIAPVPVIVYLGVRDDPGFSLAIGPLLTAVGGVVLVVILGTVLLSHRVLRPIGTLTAAAHRLGRGDLASRVPVRGNDELAALGRSFNLMADSLQSGEERQRRLIADVAHELRTPLANLRGYLEALADGVVTPDPELFASLHEEAVLQQRIVDDLQDLALAEAGNLAYHRVPVDLAELLETCRTAHRARAESAGVALAVHTKPGGSTDPAPNGSIGAALDGPTDPAPDAATQPLLVHADPDRLRQVLGNLITNALRATAAGGRVSLHAERSGGGAEIRVADTGVGIQPDALPHIFDRFWRADPARGRHSGGGGLGLAIARQIITDHGGTIVAESQVGAGSTFTITLPALD